MTRHCSELLEAGGSPGRIAFEDPDAVILAIKTFGTWSGPAFFSREELERYWFIRLD